MDATESNGALEAVPEVPVRALSTYARLWQLETWLRVMVYVELRALSGDAWATGLDADSRPFRADKSLTHMPTPEMNALSYAQLSTLLGLVDANWDCFAPYLPPRALWKAKLEEVSQVRHRVAHFRAGHADDLARVRQLLRDVDQGFWRFCTSYNEMHPVLPPQGDQVADRLRPLDPLPWVGVGDGKWAQVGMRDRSLPVGVSVRSLSRGWAAEPFGEGRPGHLYDVHVFSQDGRVLDLQRLLEATRHLHPRLVHICLDGGGDAVRVTIPAVLGAEMVGDLVARLHAAAVGAARRGPALGAGAADAIAAAWPEHVLGPSNPLTFLDPQMPCSFFGVAGAESA